MHLVLVQAVIKYCHRLDGIKVLIFIVLELGKLKIGYGTIRFWWDHSSKLAVGHDRKRGSKVSHALSYKVTNFIIKAPLLWTNYLPKVPSLNMTLRIMLQDINSGESQHSVYSNTVGIILFWVSQDLIIATVFLYLSSLQCTQALLSLQKWNSPGFWFIMVSRRTVFSLPPPWTHWIYSYI